MGSSEKIQKRRATPFHHRIASDHDSPVITFKIMRHLTFNTQCATSPNCTYNGVAQLLASHEIPMSSRCPRYFFMELVFFRSLAQQVVFVNTSICLCPSIALRLHPIKRDPGIDFGLRRRQLFIDNLPREMTLYTDFSSFLNNSLSAFALCSSCLPLPRSLA